MLVIVPNELRDAINENLDAAIRQKPEADKDREMMYDQLLNFYNEHGYVPDFSLEKK
jgi:hypothetical protein